GNSDTPVRVVRELAEQGVQRSTDRGSNRTTAAVPSARTPASARPGRGPDPGPGRPGAPQAAQNSKPRSAWRSGR
ncbi:MAG TPA: hypothetical protein VH520_03515, partial [Streptosporangiaceae bacterium]